MHNLAPLVVTGRLQTCKVPRCKGCKKKLVVGTDGKDPHCPNQRCEETRRSGTNVRCPEATCGNSDLLYHSPNSVICERGHIVRLSAPLLGC